MNGRCWRLHASRWLVALAGEVRDREPDDVLCIGDAHCSLS